LDKIRLGIIGCGMVTEGIHLPALNMSDEFIVEVLVDKDINRARELSAKFQIENVSDNYKSIVDNVDAALVTVPHYLHSSVSIDLLSQGIHVFVEKPMALTTSECVGMMRAAHRANRKIVVGHVRRFYRPLNRVKEIIDSNMLGTVNSFDFVEGNVFNWPVYSRDTFDRNLGGGVLTDTGSHTLYTLLWWLKEYETVKYFDDAMGGVEANCEIFLTMKNGVKGRVELSRNRNLRNSYLINFEYGSVEVGTNYKSKIIINKPNFKVPRIIDYTRKINYPILQVFKEQLSNYAAVVKDEKQPVVTENEACQVVELIETCRKYRQKLHYPWLNYRKAFHDD
jgi:predicted dehydrogenase